MEELLQQLEARVKDLAKKCEGLIKENIQLKQAKASLSQEKTLLLSKYTIAVNHIEKMVLQLKSLERPT